jgi:putative endopeptidase
MNTDFSKLIDPSIRPQDDFFSYVNKRWIGEHPIPNSEVRWGTFNILRDESWEAMRSIYESLQKDEPVDIAGSLARDFYYAGMHYNEFADTHKKMLQGFYKEIDAITNSENVSSYIGKLNSLEIGAPWYVWVDSDHDDSTRHILHVYQSGLTLPNRDYYLEDSETMQKIRTAYQEYTEKVYETFPELAASASELWNTVSEFETAIAKHSRTSSELRDVEKNFNKTSYASLQKTYPNISWDSYKDSLGWKAAQDLSVDQPEFLASINTMVRDEPLETWKIYLKWRITLRCIAKISEPLAQLSFSFFGKVLSGTTEMQPLWKRVVLAADSAIGEATGKLYAEKHFPESSKKQVLDLVEATRAAYAQRIDNLEWMSDTTKQYAKKKLANMKVLIGYPDVWRDFSDLTLKRDSHLHNVLESCKFDMAYWLGKLDEPTSRDDWFMNPQTVNAYNDPNRLVICFPAAILQAPFFDPKAPFAANMGGIGTVIGHELTHGFDDQGCQFDAEGNVKAWQTEEERAAFAKRAQVIVDQADAFHVLPDLTLKGALVLGESIADLGGLEIAYQALTNQLPALDDEARKLFFTNYAFTECGSIRAEKLREYTLVDPHPASEYRVNGILQHIDAFYDTFQVTEPDKLYRSPKNRARIW